LIELAEEAISDLPTAEELTVRFEQGEILERNLYYRFAWSTNNQESQLFFAGESYNLESYEHAIILTENTLLTETEWSLLNLDSQSVDLLCELIAEGGWFWQSTP
jgi:50S ribosomal protein L16 3-hydroxylase